jgi:hypothetical protein
MEKVRSLLASAARAMKSQDFDTSWFFGAIDSIDSVRTIGNDFGGEPFQSGKTNVLGRVGRTVLGSFGTLPAYHPRP